MFSNKDTILGEKILLLENKGLVNEDTEIANIFNEYFVNITSTLPIVKWSEDGRCTSIDDIVCKYENHPSILRIRALGDDDVFEFSHFTLVEVQNVINFFRSQEICIR